MVFHKQTSESTFWEMAQLYRRELMNLKNPEEYRLALELLYESALPPKPSWIEVLYHQEFGNEEELKIAEEKLRMGL